MDIYQQIQRFEQLIQFVEQELPAYAKEVGANDLIALITLRVVHKGEDKDGNKFSGYSENEVAAYKFWGKSRTASAETKVRALAKAKGALSYKEFRELNNLMTDKKNFEFTGEMFRKLGVIRDTVVPGKFVVTIGGLTPEAQRKLEANSEQEGKNIIEPSTIEIETVGKTLGVWFEQQANRIING